MIYYSPFKCVFTYFIRMNGENHFKIAFQLTLYMSVRVVSDHDVDDDFTCGSKEKERKNNIEPKTSLSIG